MIELGKNRFWMGLDWRSRIGVGDGADRAEMRGYFAVGEFRRALSAPDEGPSTFRAFVNGVSIHADDYDDTDSLRQRPHLRTSDAPNRGCFLLLSLFANLDAVPARISWWHITGRRSRDQNYEAISPRHYDEGFRSTGTCGTFGSTAACAGCAAWT